MCAFEVGEENWKKVGQKVSHAARELATVFSVSSFCSKCSWSNEECLDKSLH